MKNSLEIDEQDEELEDLDPDMDINLLAPQNCDVASGQRMPSGEDMWRSSRAAKRISKMKKFALGLTDIPMSGSQEGPVYEPGLKGPGESESSTFFGMEEDLDNNSENKPPINEKYQDNELEEDNMEDYLRDLEANLKTVGAIKAANRINKLIKKEGGATGAALGVASFPLLAMIFPPVVLIPPPIAMALAGVAGHKIEEWLGRHESVLQTKTQARDNLINEVAKVYKSVYSVSDKESEEAILKMITGLTMAETHRESVAAKAEFLGKIKEGILELQTPVTMSLDKADRNTLTQGRVKDKLNKATLLHIELSKLINNEINSSSQARRQAPGKAPEPGGAANRKQTPLMILQEKLGVKADGVWGPITQGAWNNIVDLSLKLKRVINLALDPKQVESLKNDWTNTAGKIGKEPTYAGMINLVDEVKAAQAEEATTATTEPATTAPTELATSEEIASPEAEEKGPSEEDKKAQAIETVTKLFSDIDTNALTIKKNLGINNLLARRRIRKLDGSGPAAEKVVERAWESMKGMKDFGQSNRQPGKEAALTELESFAIKVLRPTRRSERRSDRAERRAASDRSLRMNDRQIKIAKLMN